DSIADNCLSNGFSAEQANVKLFHRRDPVGHAFFINLKAQLSIYISWMCKSEMTVYITVQMFTGRISDPLFKLYQLRGLIRHIDPDIRRNSFRAVCKPLDNAGILKRRYPVRPVLVIDLTVNIIIVKLGYSVHHSSQL